MKKETRAEIITIGDELLIGQVVDTNSAWIATELNLIGIPVFQITSVSDSAAHILQTLDEASKRASLLIITGGLGPTKDDITKKTLAEYFQSPLVFDEDVYQDIEMIFASFGKEVTEVNRKQAEIPKACRPLRNKNGTAPGMWFERDGINLISLPGVPYEMKSIMKDAVLPELIRKFELPHIVHKTILTQGIGESFLASIIAGWEESLVKHNIKLAYLPSPGMVRLRLSVSGNDKARLEKITEEKIAELYQLVPEYILGREIFGEEKKTPAHVLYDLLRKSGKTVCTAESCTGGRIASDITAIAGASEVFKGSIIAYSNEVKESELMVPDSMLEKFGAVSRETVEQMAVNARIKLKTDYSMAVSGIAGPGGGTAEKPVGTVWIAVASGEKLVSEKFQFGNNRERNIRRTADTAVHMLLRLMEEA